MDATRRLLSLASELDAEAEALLAKGDKDAALRAFSRAHLLRELAEGLRPAGKQRRVTVSSMTDAQKEQISETMGQRHPAMKAARKAGLPSQRAVAKALGVSPGFLSRVLAGDKDMPEDRAAEFQRLTGFPVSRWKA